ncbi:MAG TPA: hypothetical protein VMW73_04590 [Spirochaetia bacterium]|nr:hypothetical protein [Spirochaetia bacterium]
MSRITLLAIVISSGAILVTGCTAAGSAADVQADVAQPEHPGYTDLFTPYSGPGTEAMAVRFASNDPSYMGAAGYSFWVYGTAGEADTLHMQVRVAKVSGNRTMGYGIIFAVQPGGADFYTLLIDANGNYEMGKVQARSFTPLGGGWHSSNNLLASGYNQFNELLVDADRGLIRFSLNGADMQTVVDGADVVFSGGSCGFIVTTAPDEPSQTNPVDVRFVCVLPIPGL